MKDKEGGVIHDYSALYTKLATLAIDLFDDDTDDADIDHKKVTIEQLKTLELEIADYIEDVIDSTSKCPCFSKCVDTVEDLVSLSEDIATIYTLLSSLLDLV